jgi:protein SCO1/2
MMSLIATLGLAVAMPGAGPTETEGSAVTEPPNEVLDQVDIEQKLDAQLPLDLEFRDEAGEPVRLGDFFGERPVILVLAYYECPMLCTMVLNGTLRAINVVDELNVGRDYEIVAVSIDPEESSELAREKRDLYRSKYRREGSGDGWHFLVGDQPEIDALTDAVGFRYTYDEETEQYAHGSAIMVVTPEGKMSKYLYGIDYDPRTLRLALVEASEGKIGTMVDQVILYCFNYNPLEGKYSLAIMAVLRLAAGATIIGLALFVAISVLRDRRRARLAAS